MIREPDEQVINDRFTAKVLGLVLIVFSLLIDASFFMFSTPEAKAKSGFVLIVLLPSLPFIAGGIVLLRRAEKLKEDDD